VIGSPSLGFERQSRCQARIDGEALREREVTGMLDSPLWFRIGRLASILVVLIPTINTRAAEEAVEPPQLAWQAGPLTAPIGDSLAEIVLPEGFVFLDKDETARLLVLMQNPVSGSELATVAPASDDEDWFVFFEWDPVGWVDDSEKDDLDADALLESIREGTQDANEERKARGWPAVELVGWLEKPNYDDRTNNLAWAIEASSEGKRIVNRMVKLLGRRGVMTVTIVSDPEDLDAAAATTDQLLTGYRFRPGSTYAEYVPGKDTIASYGLTALVAGGIGAAAVKSGFLAKAWKYLIVVAVAAAGGIKRLFSGRKHIADPPSHV
jgi:uncharacterized membrane-anchored protein